MIKIIFMLMMIYLLYIVLFTNKKSLCSVEKLIDLNLLNTNQYFTFRDKDNVDYILVPLSVEFLQKPVIVKLLDKLYTNPLFKAMKLQLQDENELKFVRDKISKGENDRLKREPLIAIKASQDSKLIDGILTGELKKISLDKTILYPYKSKFTEDKELVGDKQTGYKFNLDSILVYDLSVKLSVDFSVYSKLHKSLLMVDDDIEYYLLTDNKQVLSEMYNVIPEDSLLKLF